MSERIQTDKAKEILGIPRRSVQNLAARGVLPSAAQYVRDWTFDEAALRQYVAEREEANRQRAADRANWSPRLKKQVVSKVPVPSSLSAYARALGLSPEALANKKAARWQRRRGQP